MKKLSLRKILLSTILFTSALVPTMFMVSCSAAVSQINASIKIITNNIFLKDNFSFIPGSQPTFKKNGENLDAKKDELFFDYWGNVIAPAYALASSSINLDSSRPNSAYLSQNIEDTPAREPSFNYAVSNSWVSGSDIYVGDDYRFKLMPFEMNLNITGEIPKRIEKDEVLNESNIKSEVTMSDLSISFSYYSIVDGTKVNADSAIKQLKKLFPEVDFKPQYKVNLNFSSRTTYEVVNQVEDETPPPNIGDKFDPTKMKVKVTNNYYISRVPGAVTDDPNEIDVSKTLLSFKDWLLNPEKIESKYYNIITSISSN
ncbi:MAG: hypothetical protein ACRDCF_02345 [Mycoplasmoidaceae bacterium]